MANPRRVPKSKYTLDRGIPGAFEGETVTRRRFMTLSAHGAGAIAASAFALPALGFALGPVFEEKRMPWQIVGVPDDFPTDTYVPKLVSIVSGVGEAGKTTVYMRKRNPKIDTDPADQYNQYVAISTRCMHLGCPVRYVEASERFICPCHGGVYDFRGKVAGGPPVRPLDRFYTRVRNGRVEVGPRYSVNTELQRFSPRDPGEDLDGIGQYLYPSRPSVRKIPTEHAQTAPCAQAPDPDQLPPPKPSRPRTAASSARSITPPRPASRRSTGSTSAPRCRAACAGCSSARSPRAPTGSTRWARRRCSRSSRRPRPGVFLAMYYDPAPDRAYESARFITNEAFLGEFVRGMHKWGSTVMVILVFLHMARTFFFGAYKYPRELNWVIGVVLLILTMTMSFTGYLLPFDQRSYWATIVGVNINGTGPLLGPYLSDFLRGGSSSAPRRCRASTRSTCCWCRGCSPR